MPRGGSRRRARGGGHRARVGGARRRQERRAYVGMRAVLINRMYVCMYYLRMEKDFK